MLAKRKGYRTERKIKLKFEEIGWKVLRAGASLGEADLICVKGGKCILLQIKSTGKKTLYYYGYMKRELEGFSYFLVVDFGYGKTRILFPKEKVELNDGMDLDDFLKEN